MADNKHLTLSNRIFIEKALNDNMSRKAIADHLGKDKLLSARKLRITPSVNPSLEFCITEPAPTTAPGSRNADSTLSALPYAAGEFLSHAQEKILQAVYVTGVPNCIPAS